MSSKRNYKNELLIQSKKDNAKKLMINKCFIENMDEINRKKNKSIPRCIYLCKCGKMGNKDIRQILDSSGLFCDRCTEINRNTKMGKRNKIDDKLLKLCIRWWLVKIGKNYTNRKKWSKEDGGDPRVR